MNRVFFRVRLLDWWGKPIKKFGSGMAKKIKKKLITKNDHIIMYVCM